SLLITNHRPPTSTLFPYTTLFRSKRKVRKDLADMFCTNQDGVRGQRAKDWGLVDEIVKPQQFAEHVKQRALKLAESSDRPVDARSEEHTSELQSRGHLVCRLLLEK